MLAPISTRAARCTTPPTTSLVGRATLREPPIARNATVVASCAARAAGRVGVAGPFLRAAYGLEVQPRHHPHVDRDRSGTHVARRGGLSEALDRDPMAVRAGGGFVAQGDVGIVGRKGPRAPEVRQRPL